MDIRKITNSTILPNEDRLTADDRLPIPTGPDSTLYAWDKRADESLAWYEKFQCYLRLGVDRTITEAVRRWLVERQELLPGEPPPRHFVLTWYKESNQRHWVERAHTWDYDTTVAIQTEIEKERQKRITDSVNQALDGWEVFQTAAIRSVYEKNDDGSFKLDENGQPILRDIGNVTDAARVFKYAVQGKRIELGLPQELWVLKQAELIRRYKS